MSLLGGISATFSELAEQFYNFLRNSFVAHIEESIATTLLEINISTILLRYCDAFVKYDNNGIVILKP
jgi:hypothetical protein